ncbi:DUF4338 domain-containing protein [bacterium]|nr:DUF4338 domain-containing protein [bacterium]
MDEDKKIVIRNQILQNLEDYGISWAETEQKLECEDFKSTQLKLSKQTNPNPDEYYHYVQSLLATPNEVNIDKIKPYLIVAQSNRVLHQRLWAYATSLWSVPVTVGFGRRIRFFVFDRQNNKLIGVIGLCDPIIGLDIRDRESIGWSKEVKETRIYNSMTAYILGAIPPYNSVLGAKLVALMLLLPEVRQVFYRRYKDSALEKGKQPYLAYIDTLGAFGKSSIYNRLLGWEFVGYTKGQSHIHITANGSWELIREVVPDEVFNTFKFGDGPNWKMRVLKYGLRQLDFSEEMLSIGWRRGYYRLPLAQNWQDFLLNKTNRIVFNHHTKTELVNYWKDKWVLPRREVLQERLDQTQA